MRHPRPAETRRPRAADRSPRRRRSLVRRVVAVVGLLVVSLSLGTATASTTASLGPHVARYEVTVDDLVTVDLGPLGTLVIDSPLPLVLGTRVVVREIPSEVTALDDASTLQALGDDLQRYVQFFSSPQASLEDAARGLVVDALRRSALWAVGLTVAGWSLAWLLGERRRAELSARLGPHRAAVGGGIALALVVALLPSSGGAAGTQAVGATASAVFDGTPLEGARITGRLAGVVDTYGGYVVDAYRQNEAFYDAAAESVRREWAEREAADALLTALRRPPATGEAAPAGEAAGGAGGPAGQEPGSATAGDDPTSAVVAPEAAEGDGTAPDAHDAAEPPVTLLVVSDLHCNVGMARVIRTVAELSGADVVLNAGDTTVNGTAVEQSCVTAFADAVPAGAVQVVSDGNHDSAQTSAQEARTGARVLDGAVLEVAGLRVLGDSDPRATRIGVGTLPVGEETTGDAARRLADVACDDGDVDLLLVHTPAVGGEALARGCVPAQVSGHLHTRSGPEWVGRGVRYISASSAGASLDQPTIGPLRGTAELTVLRFDPATRRVLDHRLVRVQPDGVVTVGIALEWPSGPFVRERAPRVGEPR